MLDFQLSVCVCMCVCVYVWFPALLINYASNLVWAKTILQLGLELNWFQKCTDPNMLHVISAEVKVCMSVIFAMVIQIVYRHSQKFH